METKFRPIPLTIVDFLAIFIPGCIWLLLLNMTLLSYTAARTGGGAKSGISMPTLLSAARDLVAKVESHDKVVGGLIVVLAALTIGWLVKPYATILTEMLSKHLGWAVKKTRSLSRDQLEFPYTRYFEKMSCYEKVKSAIENVTGCKIDHLEGRQPFSAAKQYLRMTAPALWEESERAEAEVRITAAMCLASAYHTALAAGICVITQSFSHLGSALVSAVIMCFLGVSFNQRRIREVGHTYALLILALGVKSAMPLARTDPKDG